MGSNEVAFTVVSGVQVVSLKYDVDDQTNDISATKLLKLLVQLSTR